TLCKVVRRVKFRSIFCASSQNFKILVIPNVLAYRKSYKHGFIKKCNCHKLCTKSRAESSFDRFFVHRQGISKILTIPNVLDLRKLYEVLTIPNVLAHWNLYEHGFVK
ncbi:hypothetical protein BHM03_00035816, partial [Ensete ventricosum]